VPTPPSPSRPERLSSFRSLRVPNYRRYALGAFVSNVGTWMQRTAQDWLVLAELTNQSATALGLVMALQFGPSLLLLPLTGWAADRFDRRRLLMVTQVIMGGLALALGLLTVFGAVQLWHVYAFAFVLGCTTAFNAPARQSFVSEVVGPKDLANAVALNSTSFQSARLIGPAVAGVVVSAVGSGVAFLVNAASFAAVLLSLATLRVAELHREPKAPGAGRGGFADGLREIGRRRDLQAVLLMLFLVTTFGLNFPIFISTMALGVFKLDAHHFGFLTSLLAAGAVAGALLSARRAEPGLPVLTAGAALFGVACLAAAAMPNVWLFGAVLVVVGLASQTFMTTSNGIVQLGTAPALRGRVMAIYLAIALGATPLGSPVVGRVADLAGPRWAIAVGAASGLLAALVGWLEIRRRRAIPPPFGPP
jgi:MFS family permease